MEEVCYDTPWDEKCVNANLLISQLQKNTRDYVNLGDNSPTNNLRPKQSPTNSKDNDLIDVRPESEYDVPWDRSRMENKLKGHIVCTRKTRPASQSGKSCNKVRSEKTSSVCYSSESNVVPCAIELMNNESSVVTLNYTQTKSPSSQHLVPHVKHGAPLMETVFCGPAVSNMPVLGEEVEREKLIQKLSQSAKLSPIKKPKPAVRKSKITSSIKSAKSCETENTTIKRGVEYDIPCEIQEPKPKTPEGSRPKLSLNLGTGNRRCGEKVDVDVPLEQQTWYHACICRNEAESRLKDTREGTYLVRICESNRREYALSLKSARGYMHMKIQRNASGEWILGYFSQPFSSIATMLQYYSLNKLPIKGADHMCLVHPLLDALL